MVGSLSGSNVLYSQTAITSFTNHNLVLRQGVCEPVLTNYVAYATNLVLVYSNTLLNVVTNSYFSNSWEMVITTNIFTTNGAMAGTLYTNIMTNTLVLTNVTSGDFWILPTNWCGYNIIIVTNPGVVTTSSTTVATIPAGVPNIGQQFSLTTVSEYTNHALVIQPGICEPVLQFGTNYTTNFVVQYNYTFGNVQLLTNSYFTSSPVTVFTTNTYVVPWSRWPPQPRRFLG